MIREKPIRLIRVVALFAAAYISAVYLGGAGRASFAIVLAGLLVLSGYLLLKVEWTHLNEAIASAHFAIAFNALNEAFWFVAGDYGVSPASVGLVNLGDAYEFGNYVRFWPAAYMALVLSGIIANKASNE